MKRRTKLLIIILIGVFLTILIYQHFENHKINFVSLGDSVAYGTSAYSIKGSSFNDIIKETIDSKSLLKSFNNEYCLENITSSELLKILLDKQIINSKPSLAQIIGAADLITIAIGYDELNNNGNINLYLYNMEQILSELRKINKKKIALISLYGNNNKINDINANLKIFANKNDIEFIDITDLDNNNYQTNANNIHLNYQGHYKISQKILNNPKFMI
jgi:hypothetical protein